MRSRDVAVGRVGRRIADRFFVKDPNCSKLHIGRTVGSRELQNVVTSYIVNKFADRWRTEKCASGVTSGICPSHLGTGRQRLRTSKQKRVQVGRRSRIGVATDHL